MEMAVRKAETVSAVLVLNLQKFANGIRDLKENGEMIQRLLKNCTNKNLSIHIVFNRYHTDYKPCIFQFCSLNGKEKLNFVYSRIDEIAEQINKHKNNQSNIEYFDLIYQNIKDKNFSYIDVQDEEIINIIRNKFQSLPSISKNNLKFNNSSQIRVEFDLLYKNKLVDLTNKIRLILESKYYILWNFWIKSSKSVINKFHF